MKRYFFLLIFVTLLLACQRLPAPTPQPTATFLPEPTAVPPTSTPPPTATATIPLTPPPTPESTATAELWLAEGWQLNRYPADQPLVFLFSAPMDVERGVRTSCKRLSQCRN